MKRISLTLAQRHKLNMWLVANSDRLHAQGPTLRRAAEEASLDLGFPVNYHHLEGAREAVAIVWKTIPAKPARPAKPKLTSAIVRAILDIRHFLQAEGFTLPPLPEELTGQEGQPHAH